MRRIVTAAACVPIGLTILHRAMIRQRLEISAPRPSRLAKSHAVPMGQYRFLDDVALADCAVELDGSSLGDLFETAALALCDVIADPVTVTPTVARTLTLEAPDGGALLYDWLAELILRKDRDGEIYPSCSARVSDGPGPWRLEARLQGAEIHGGGITLRADVKAVTLHQFELRALENGFRARF